MSKAPPLGAVPSDVRCTKAGCTVSDTRRLQRHHVRHQAMWLGIWAGRRRGEPRFVELQERYAQFRAEDVALLHDDHHAEIHSIYDQIINADKKRLGIALYHYTWKQAEALMDKLEAAFNEWVGRETPGVNQKDYGRTRQLYRRALRGS